MDAHGSARLQGRHFSGVSPSGALVGALGLLAAAGLLLAMPAQAAPPRVAGATYVGSDTCKGCHEDVAKGMEQSLHGKLLGTKLSKGPLQAQGCEGCHGAGSKHMENPADPAGNLRFGKQSPLSPADQNAMCLQCHARGKQILWAGSPHEARDITCVTCHTMHGPHTQKAQLKLISPARYDSRGQLLDAAEYDLCGQCHQVKAMQFQLSSHMPMTARGEGGRMTCGSCHNPHGTTTEKLIAAVSINDNCTSCHAAKRGPFLWSHVPVLENCLNCHHAHGSNLQSLLRVQMPRLCQQCHANTGHNSRPFTPPGIVPNSRVYNRSCVNCHLAIHGSNHPSGAVFTR